LLFTLFWVSTALKTPFAEINGEFVGLELEAGLEKDLSQLPPFAAQQLGIFNENPLLSQPLIAIPSPSPSNIVVIPSVMQTIQPVDRSGRNIETRLDLRPSTYRQKTLVGEIYTTLSNDTGNIDPDGLCRNSRQEIIDCSLYVSAGNTSVPPIMESLDDIMNEHSRLDWSPPGPCVLKCQYHKGPTSSAGSLNIETISIEIPTSTGVNNTFGCPKTNNGYPFISCNLLIDQSDKCVSTCIFDGDANPLKPSQFAIGKVLTGPKEFKFDPAEFQTYLHSTYQVKTRSGCKSSMGADPLVACEVQL